MRKQNSVFKIAFLSEAGSELNNHDYFTYAELNGFACYVLVDGLNDLGETENARPAIGAIILEFQEYPSVRKEAVSSYLHTASEALLHSGSREWLKASITMLVSDYTPIRYGSAGNTRLRMYRDGNMMEQSQGMSLSQKLLSREKISEDVVSKYKGCNNLYGYLGQEQGFNPDMSEWIKLVNGDIITLHTRGIWENADEGELGDVFSEAKDEPRESLDSVEKLLLARRPEQLENYTLAVPFVDKVYLGPSRTRKIKKRVTTTVIAILVTLCVYLVTWIVKRVHRNVVDSMNQYYADIVDYIHDQSFVRVRGECKEALKGAKRPCDRKKAAELTARLKLTEAVNEVDDVYGSGKYKDTQAGYVIAREHSQYADHVTDSYIEKRLSGVTNYLSVFDYAQLGDSLTAQGDYVRAEEKYLEVKRVAAAAYYPEGETNAVKVLKAMYTVKDKAEEEEEKTARARTANEVGAAEPALEDGKVFKEGNYMGANAFYTMTMERYQELGNESHTVTLQVKIQSGNVKTEGPAEKEMETDTYLSPAEETEATGDMLEAKKQYLSIKNVYRNLNQEEKVTGIDGILDVVNVKVEQQAEEEERIAVQEISEEDGSMGEEPQGKDNRGEAVKVETGLGAETREGEA